MCDCDYTGCPNQADSFVQWGSSKEQQGNLCARHINDIWVKSQPLIATGKLFWVQGVVKGPT